MLGRRRKPPVVARLPDRDSDSRRPGSLDRAELAAFDELLNAFEESRVVLVTGDQRRSAVALGLAVTAVAAGRQAILVEADLSRRNHASHLGLEDAPGLSEYLRHRAEATQILQTLVLAGPGAGQASAPLIYIASGMPTPLAPSLLASERFAHAIAGLRSGYDLVVIDGPGFADRPSLLAASRYVDTMLASSSPSAVPEALMGSLDGLVEPTAGPS